MVREVAFQMYINKEISILQKNKILVISNLNEIKGPIRLKLYKHNLSSEAK